MINFPQIHIVIYGYVDIDESHHNGDIVILYDDFDVYIRRVL
jgi:hypothetical protein